jgi:lantibiotic leader peptide-processing serine protease
MIKRRRRALCTTVALLVVVAVSTLGAPAAVATPTTGPRTYVLIGANERLPADIQQRVEGLGGSVTFLAPEVGLAVATATDPAFAASASAVPGLRSVLPDVMLPLESGAAPAVAGNPPFSGDDDALFDLQWGLDAIDAPEAWAAGYRGGGARVAVLDSGIDIDHPDLAANLNLGLSTSFIPGVGVDAPPGPAIPVGGPLHHGTWVAGIVAAADNGIGTIGVAPEAEIVAVRVCHEPLGPCPFSAMMAGIVYAATVGADVINLSIMHTLPRSAVRDDQGNVVPANQVADLLIAFRRAFRFADTRGATSIVIAGNDARNLDGDGDLVQLWADLPQVVAVSATGPNGWGLDPATPLDLPAFYTNYGRSAIDLAAPGGNLDFDLLVPDPFAHLCTVVVTLPCAAFDLVVAPTADGWTFAFGTSAAAPHVAGVAALVIGANGGAMRPADVEAALRASADDLGSPGLDPFYGHGRINAAGAVHARPHSRT